MMPPRGRALVLHELVALLDKLSPDDYEAASRTFLDAARHLDTEPPAAGTLEGAAHVTIKAFSAIARRASREPGFTHGANDV
ncbi:MAG: hypothetical protein ACXWLY_31370 [Thermoanaerobaculia bacterium]